MSLRTFIDSLSEEEQDAYAERCGTTGRYLRTHIKYARKFCRPELQRLLADESYGAVTLDEVQEHFFSRVG